jgi:hypothetical protein
LVNLQYLRRSFFSLAATATSASKTMPRSRNITGNGMRLARAGGFAFVAEAGIGGDDSDDFAIATWVVGDGLGCDVGAGVGDAGGAVGRGVGVA